MVYFENLYWELTILMCLIHQFTIKRDLGVRPATNYGRTYGESVGGTYGGSAVGNYRGSAGGNWYGSGSFTSINMKPRW